MSIEKILVVDDELLMRNFLVETLKRKNFDVSSAENGQKATSLLKNNSYDLVITDMKMPDMTGIDVLKKVKELSPKTYVIIITAFGSIENAVEAMRLGAFNYLIKPFSPGTIEAALEKVEEHLNLVAENHYLREQVASSGGTRTANKMIGESPSMRKVIDDVLRVAKSNASIFITGESGTGKEVVAHAIHSHSLRASRPYIRVNCAAIPETLIESEFFGHEKGAFTGANWKHTGRFELAHGGSLLLDEITEIPLSLQPKLLRAIQEREFDRVGGTKPIHVDVRIISTSNRNMKEAIDSKIFREDLYYRLNVIPIQLPPLRARCEDILPLAEHFLDSMCIENHKSKKHLTPEAKKKLLSYSWPGNIRELANIIERAIVMDYGSAIEADHIYMENHIPQKQAEPTNAQVSSLVKGSAATPLTSNVLPVGVSLHELEKRFIVETLQAQNQDRQKTAETLGISIRTLRNKIHEYNMIKAND